MLPRMPEPAHKPAQTKPVFRTSERIPSTQQPAWRPAGAALHPASPPAHHPQSAHHHSSAGASHPAIPRLASCLLGFHAPHSHSRAPASLENSKYSSPVNSLYRYYQSSPAPRHHNSLPDIASLLARRSIPKFQTPWRSREFQTMGAKSGVHFLSLNSLDSSYSLNSFLLEAQLLRNPIPLNPLPHARPRNP